MTFGFIFIKHLPLNNIGREKYLGEVQAPRFPPLPSYGRSPVFFLCVFRKEVRSTRWFDPKKIFREPWFCRRPRSVQLWASCQSSSLRSRLPIGYRTSSRSSTFNMVSFKKFYFGFLVDSTTEIGDHYGDLHTSERIKETEFLS